MPEEKLTLSVVNRVLAAFQTGVREQTLIERTLGRAVLDKLQGKQPDLSTTYSRLGGNDPVASRMFAMLEEPFVTLDVTPGIAQARKIAVDQGTSAAKSEAVYEGNPMFTVDGTALNTLAGLGGKEFKQKFQVP